jgi:nicotinate-nucleotide pyrophosphorylase (carboxylating)
MGSVEVPPGAVADAVERALAEDLGELGDVTAALIGAEALAKGRIVARAGGVLAGIACVDETYRRLDDRVRLEWEVRDGSRVEAGTTLATVEGPARSVLTGERTALNFLCHLSGIATLTRRFVDVAAGRVAILDTRKTLPGLRVLEKAAVRAGGGVNHRMSLSDMVLVKDNHLAELGVRDAVDRARELWPEHRVEVECDRVEQVEAAIDAGADVVMLDNMTPEGARACVEHVRASTRPRTAIEISGGITLDTLDAYAATGADACSTSAITQSAPALDISLDLLLQ